MVARDGADRELLLRHPRGIARYARQICDPENLRDGSA
jgi:hypothetical protein